MIAAVVILSIALAASLATNGALAWAAITRSDRVGDQREARALAEGKRDAALSGLDVAVEELTEAHARTAALEEAAHATGTPVPGAGRVGMLSALRRIRDRVAGAGAAGRDPGDADVPVDVPASSPE